MKRLLPAFALVLLLGNAAAWAVVLTGTVLDSQGDPVPGVRVQAVDRPEWTMTDIDGRYRLDIDGHVRKLSFEYVGYKPIIRTAKPEMTLTLGNGWAGNPKGYRGFWNFNMGFGTGGDVNIKAGDCAVTDIGKTSMACGFDMTHGYQINEHLFAGIGAGIQPYFVSGTEHDSYQWGDRKTTYGQDTQMEGLCVLVPVYADVRWDFGLREKTAPYVGLRLGYTATFGMDDDYSKFGSSAERENSYQYLEVYNQKMNSFLLQPYAGMRTAVGQKVGFNIGISWNTMVDRAFTARYTSYPDRDWSNPEVQEIGIPKSKGGIWTLTFGWDW